MESGASTGCLCRTWPLHAPDLVLVEQQFPLLAQHRQPHELSTIVR